MILLSNKSSTIDDNSSSSVINKPLLTQYNESSDNSFIPIDNTQITTSMGFSYHKQLASH
jgi:hypothetical protein